MSLARLGALADLWAAGRPEHLPLLHLASPDAERVIRRLREIGEHAPTIRDDIRAALSDQDWRPQLVGAVCVALGLGDAHHVETLWDSALRGSWVSPQLLAVASLVDPEFGTRARNAFRLILGTQDAGGLPTAIATDWPAQHSKQGPSGAAERRGKALAALFALVDHGEPWVRECSSDPRARAALEADVDDGGGIARRWRERMAAYR